MTDYFAKIFRRRWEPLNRACFAYWYNIFLPWSEMEEGTWGTGDEDAEIVRFFSSIPSVRAV